jgi:hypothetical protein
MVLRVECEPGPAGQPEPHAVWFGARRVAVRDVVDRWWGETQRWWKVDTEEGPYVLRLDEASGTWELAAVCAADTLAVSPSPPGRGSG